MKAAEIPGIHDAFLPVNEANDVLRAIRTGEVDALVVAEDGGPQVYVLERANAELEAKVLARTRELSAANAALQAQIRAAEPARGRAGGD